MRQSCAVTGKADGEICAKMAVSIDYKHTRLLPFSFCLLGSNSAWALLVAMRPKYRTVKAHSTYMSRPALSNKGPPELPANTQRGTH